MPWRDWQFWVVSVLSLVAAALVARQLWPMARSLLGMKPIGTKSKVLLTITAKPNVDNNAKYRKLSSKS